ncbi:hypothetical protein BD779DRAFT_1667358 [Infundibulicybe gibba]|nr:hypothetical protein BD779DRAFT_1667358 [Infundibulicybe gibba]
MSPSSTPQFLRQPAPLLAPNLRSLSHGPVYTRPRGLRIANLLRSWLPLILYAFTSLSFVFAIALYRDQVFARLDELSHWLQADESFGHAVLFVLIFLTTFPPIPLYSTLITLSGYTFGPWTGAIISYFAALSGALTVFIISRGLLRETISRAQNALPRSAGTVPYNVMNCLLAASPTLTLRTYSICTALSLFKVIIHTSLGASIHSFKDYHTSDPDDDDMAAQLWTILGILLCVAIFIYLSIVARRAVDEELDDEVITSHDSEETMAFLSPEGARGDERGPPGRGRLMAESPFRTQQLVPFRQSAEPEGDGWS